jgi:hypothetical protein
MESEEVKVGRIDWVSQWFEKSRTATKHVVPETNAPGKERFKLQDWWGLIR